MIIILTVIYDRTNRDIDIHSYMKDKNNEDEASVPNLKSRTANIVKNLYNNPKY